MKKFKLFFIDCSQAAKYCDKAQYKEAKCWEKIKMFLHIKLCDQCREYNLKNTKLSSLIKKSELKTCREEDKKNWEGQIQSELSKEKH